MIRVDPGDFSRFFPRVFIYSVFSKNVKYICLLRIFILTLLQLSVEAMNDIDDVFKLSPDSYKWLIMAINHETIKRGIFSDLKQVGEIVGVHEATLRNRFKTNKNQDRIDINGFSVIKIAYFKSQRGRAEKNISYYSKKKNNIDVLTNDESVKIKVKDIPLLSINEINETISSKNEINNIPDLF